MVVVVAGCSAEQEYLGRLPWEIIARVHSGAALNLKEGIKEEAVHMKLFPQESAWAYIWVNVAEDEFKGVGILSAQSDRLAIGMVPFVNMLIEEAGVKEPMSVSKYKFLDD